MTYELAKQLKDNGFPQRQRYDPVNDEWEEKEVCIPTLSELIEACGDSFETLEKFDYVEDPKYVVRNWRAYMTEKAFDDTGIPCVRDCDGYENGSTPEEAVARIWLAIKKVV